MLCVQRSAGTERGVVGRGRLNRDLLTCLTPLHTCRTLVYNMSTDFSSRYGTARHAPAQRPPKVVSTSEQVPTSSSARDSSSRGQDELAQVTSRLADLREAISAEEHSIKGNEGRQKKAEAELKNLKSVLNDFDRTGREIESDMSKLRKSGKDTEYDHRKDRWVFSSAYRQLIVEKQDNDASIAAVQGRREEPKQWLADAKKAQAVSTEHIRTFKERQADDERILATLQSARPRAMSYAPPPRAHYRSRRPSISTAADGAARTVIPQTTQEPPSWPLSKGRVRKGSLSGTTVIPASTSSVHSGSLRNTHKIPTPPHASYRRSSSASSSTASSTVVPSHKPLRNYFEIGYEEACDDIGGWQNVDACYLVKAIFKAYGKVFDRPVNGSDYQQAMAFANAAGLRRSLTRVEKNWLSLMNKLALVRCITQGSCTACGVMLTATGAHRLAGFHTPG